MSGSRKNIKIIAHCLVKNEERFVWYAINSVLDYVDKVVVWDTGSTDLTKQIVNLIKSPKVEFTAMPDVDQNSFTHLRQQMLNATSNSYTWIMILDGDEIWPEKSISLATTFCRQHPEFESVVVRSVNLVGDIYHKMPESSGNYHLAGHIGHLNLRFMNLSMIPKLNVQKPHGQQGYFDANGVLVQDRHPDKIKFLDVAYFHATHLARSSQDTLVMKRIPKFKQELGAPIDQTQLPQVFFSKRPKIVPNVTHRMSFKFWLISALLTPIKTLKRAILPPVHGY